MINIFQYEDYRLYLNTWLADQSLKRKGLRLKMAAASDVSPTLFSLGLTGDKQLNLDQGNDIADFIGLNERENEFFLLLIELGRAGSFRLKKRLGKRIKELQAESLKLSKRILKDRELDGETRAIFYSNWLYSGVRNASAIPEINDPTQLADRLNVPLKLVVEVIEFLVAHGLCISKSTGLLPGPVYTHAPAESPFALKHHQNWRLKGFEHMQKRNQEDLFYTCPMSLSLTTAAEIHQLLLETIDEVQKRMRPSPSETVACFNIDWFNFDNLQL